MEPETPMDYIFLVRIKNIIVEIRCRCGNVYYEHILIQDELDANNIDHVPYIFSESNNNMYHLL